MHYEGVNARCNWGLHSYFVHGVPALFVVYPTPLDINSSSQLLCLQDCYLVYILTEKCQCTTMVFTRTCDATRLLALMLRNLGIRATPISGHMSQVCYIELTLVGALFI